MLPLDYEAKCEAEKEKLQEFKEKVEKTMKLYPPHNFICFLAQAGINEEPFQDPTLSTIIVSNKSPAIISKLKGFLTEDYQDYEADSGKKFRLSVIVKVQKMLSVILYAISSNFYKYVACPKIGMLPAETFKNLLKHKRLQVFCEDDIVKAFYLWANDPSHSQSHISMIVPDINWNYVSLPCLLELIQKSPKIR